MAGRASDLGGDATTRGFREGQRVFGRYLLQRVLGRGGMGVVWLAHDEQLERRAAIKFLPELILMDPEAIRDLKRETRRNLELTHPNIVRIYDFEQDDLASGITMEYVEGETLAVRKVRAPSGCLDVETVTPWLMQIGEALHYAHTKPKVAHRDLKPANIMLQQDGEIKITDFGIASSISDTVSRVSMRAGTSGTPVFMSPQQALGERPTARDDIYSLGATIYDLLTGKPPFYTGELMHQLQHVVPPLMRDRRRELDHAGPPIPEVWERVVAACLAKNPSDRPASVREVAESLAPKETSGSKTSAKAPPPDDAPPALPDLPAFCSRGIPPVVEGPKPPPHREAPPPSPVRPEIVLNTPAQRWVVGIAGFLAPGLGHLLLGRWIMAGAFMALSCVLWVLWIAGPCEWLTQYLEGQTVGTSVSGAAWVLLGFFINYYIARHGFRLVTPESSLKGITVAASLLVPGLGQCLCGRSNRGVVMFVLSALLWVVLLGWTIHLWSAIDAALSPTPKKCDL